MLHVYDVELPKCCKYCTVLSQPCKSEFGRAACFIKSVKAEKKEFCTVNPIMCCTVNPIMCCTVNPIMCQGFRQAFMACWAGRAFRWQG